MTGNPTHSQFRRRTAARWRGVGLAWVWSVVLVASCTPSTGSYALPLAERQMETVGLRLSVPASLDGPLDTALHRFCEVDRTSVEVARSSTGDIALAWDRAVDWHRFEIIEHRWQPMADRAAELPDKYRLTGTDETFDGVPRDEDVIPEGQRAAAAVLRRGAVVPEVFAVGIGRKTVAVHPGKRIFWSQGQLHCIWMPYGPAVLSRLTGPRPGALAELPVESSAVLSVHEDAQGPRVFGVRSYYRDGEPPPCFGGSSSSEYWHSVGIPSPTAPRRIFRDVYLKWRDESPVAVVRSGADGFGMLVLVDHSSIFLDPWPEQDVYWQEGITEGRRSPVILGKTYIEATHTAVTRSDGEPTVVWMEEVSRRNRCGDVPVIRLAVVEKRGEGAWRRPMEIARGEHWSHYGLAVAAGADNTVYALWPDEDRRLNYVARSAEGVWGPPVRTSLRIGTRNWLVPAGEGQFVLVTYLEGNLYWCRVAPARAEPPSEAGGADGGP
jgi:hypothetical protein